MSVEVGLLEPNDWTAKFITPVGLGAVGAPAPVLCREVKLGKGVAKARLYITAHGIYEATVNGAQVGKDVLAPGWTSYDQRLRYNTHDVTSLLRAGNNTVEVLLGEGWYRGGPSTLLKRQDERRDGAQTLYGARLALLAQLEVSYEDGSIEVVGTDETWTARESAVVANDLYDGQRVDWTRGEFAAGGVETIDADLARLVAPEGPPVRVIEVVPAVKVFESASGSTLVDFGQNLVGWVRLRTRGSNPGDEIVIRHAEVLEDGELCVRPLHKAKATDSYVLAGPREVVLEPSLTFHGFRYAEITGAPQVERADVDAVVVGTDLRRTGWFSCSDPDLEQLHENVVWSTRGNFLHVPTDCPQRAERLGWTGDIQIFAPTSCFLFDTAGFLSSWLADLAVDQQDDGSVPFVIPDIYRLGALPVEPPVAAGWGDAATVVPWVLYQRYGDLDILARQFNSMRSWVDKVASLTRNGVRVGGFQWGDWVDPTAPPDDPWDAKADADVVATAYLARSAQIVAETAVLLNCDDAATRYAELAERTREAFAREYVTGSGLVISDAETVYALALQWALLPTPEQREHAAHRLADLVRINGFRISTGFLGTPLMTDALTSTGHVDVAYRLLLEKTCPSWLYPVTMGATTIWERWDSMRPDGSVNPGQMVSFNHYALGAVADWMHRTVAGLAPRLPGYREITVHPLPHRSLTYASARHLTPYGEASVAWERSDGRFTVKVVVPVGAMATVHLPDADPVTVRHGMHAWAVPDPCENHDGGISTVRDLIDSRRWSTAVGILIEHGLDNDPLEIARHAGRYLDWPAVELPALLRRGWPPVHSDEARQAIEELLA
nr:family 78 glycoside hydrolase catalytic domain [Phytoactinopolyspora halotolerans]